MAPENLLRDPDIDNTNWVRQVISPGISTEAASRAPPQASIATSVINGSTRRTGILVQAAVTTGTERIEHRVLPESELVGQLWRAIRAWPAPWQSSGGEFPLCRCAT